MATESILSKSEEIQGLIADLTNKLLTLGFNLNKKDDSNKDSRSIQESLSKLLSILSSITSSSDSLKNIQDFFQKEELNNYNLALESIIKLLSESISKADIWVNDFNSDSITDATLDQLKESFDFVQKVTIYSIAKKPIQRGIILDRQVHDLDISRLDDEVEKIKPLFRFLSYNPRSAKELTLKVTRELNKEALDSISLLKTYINESIANVKKTASIRNEMDHLKDSADELMEKMDVYCENADKKTEQIEKIRKENEVILTESKSIKESIDRNYLYIETTVNEAKKDRDAINKDLLSVQESISTVEKVSKNAEKAHDIFDGLKEQSKSVLEKANEILTTSGSVVLGKNFEGQYEEAKKGLKVWPVFGGAFLLLAISICIYAIQTHVEKGEAAIIISRLAIAPIALIGVWFSANQYVKQKQIIEDYAYKKTLALSLVSFKKELKETKTNHEREYMLEVLKELHKSPLESLDKKYIREELKVIERMKINFLKEISDTLEIKNNSDKKDESKKDEDKK